MSSKVALIYGFGEGPWHGKQFQKRLRGANFEVVANTQDADTVIAHSAGAFYVPQLRDDQTIMLINPTYWPGRNPLSQMIAKVWADYKYNAFHHPLYLAQKTAWNIFYILRDFGRTREIIKLSKHFHLPAAIGHHKTIIIRNHTESWLTNDLERLKAVNSSLQIHRIPGEHDDCWLHPDKYVDLLQSDT